MYHQAPPRRLLALVARRRATAAIIGADSPLAARAGLAAPFSSSRSARAPGHEPAAPEPTAPAPAPAPAPPTPTPEAEARSALRAALRAVGAHFTPVAGNGQWRAYVLEQARKLRASAPGDDRAARVAAAAETARDYAELVETVARHVALLREYNIGVDPDARNRAMVEKTAARVGLSIPKSRSQREDEEEEEEEAGRAAADEQGGQGAGGGGGGARPSIARRAAMARASAALGERAAGGARRKQ